MIRREIKIFDFKSEAETIVKSKKEALEFTQMPYKTLMYQLENPDARVHELAEGMKKGTLPTLTYEVAKKTQTFSCQYLSDAPFKVIKVVKKEHSKSFALTDDVHYFNSVVEVASFLGKSRQTIYNAHSLGSLKSKPLKTKSGEYYLVDTGNTLEPTGIKEKKCFLGMVVYPGKPAEPRITYDPFELYLWVNAVSPVDMKMSKEEFIVSCDNLEAINSQQQRLVDGEEFSWIELIPRNKDCRYGFAATYNSLDNHIEPFTHGVLVVRLS